MPRKIAWNGAIYTMRKTSLKPLSPRPLAIMVMLRKAGTMTTTEIIAGLKAAGMSIVNCSVSMELTTLKRHGLVEYDKTKREARLK